MSKRGQTKLSDVVRAVKDIADYNGAQASAESIVMAIVTGDTPPRARSRTFTAKPCTSCTALRESSGVDIEANFTRVFATRGNIRYCKCHYCGNTWKDSDG